MNQLLQQTEQQILSKAHPKLVPVIQQIVKAGKQVMYSESTRHMLLNQFKRGGDPAEVVGEAIAKLMGILWRESKGTIPMQAAAPAAAMLLCEGMNFLEESGVLQVTPELLANSTKAMSANLLQLFGVSPERFQQFLEKATAGNGMGMGGGNPTAISTPAAATPSAPVGIIARARQGGAA